MEIFSIEPLTLEEVASCKPRVQSLRHAHHTMAKLLARGLKDSEVARITNRSPPTVRNFRLVPANAELIDSYAGDTDEEITSLIDYRRTAMVAAEVKAMEEIIHRLDTVPDQISTSALLAIAANSQDRSGIAKQTVSLNMNLDFGSKLDRARERLAKLQEARKGTLDNVITLVRGGK